MKLRTYSFIAASVLLFLSLARGQANRPLVSKEPEFQQRPLNNAQSVRNTLQYYITRISPPNPTPGDTIVIIVGPPARYAPRLGVTFSGVSEKIISANDSLMVRVPLYLQTGIVIVGVVELNKGTTISNLYQINLQPFPIHSISASEAEPGSKIIIQTPFPFFGKNRQATIEFISLIDTIRAVGIREPSGITVTVPDSLQPGTRYLIRVVNGRQSSKTAIFKTSPKSSWLSLDLTSWVIGISAVIIMLLIRSGWGKIKRLWGGKPLSNKIRYDAELAAPDVAAPVARVQLPPPEVPIQLVEAIAERQCVLFAGAGLSAQAGFPTWRAFVKQLLDWSKNQGIAPSFASSLEFALQDGQYDAVADSIVNSVDRKLLNDFLKDVFLKPKQRLPEAHRFLSRMPFSAMLTTNFDTLLEQMSVKKENPIYTPLDAEPLLESLSGRKSFVLKLYGDLENPKSVLVAPAQYEDAIAGNRMFSQFMESLFFSRTILFVGASIEGIMGYLRGISFRGNIPTSHYALVAVTEPAWQTKAELLKRRFNIEVIPYAPSDNYAELPAFLKTLVESIETNNKKSEARGSKFAEADEQQPFKPFRLERVTLENIGPFEYLDLTLHEDWNMLLGDNGVGKSTILKAIALGICGKDGEKYADRLIKSGKTSATIILQTGRRNYITRILKNDMGAEVTIQPSRPMETEGWLALGFPPLRTVTWERSKGIPQQEGKARPTSQDLLPLLKGEPDPRLDKLKEWIVNLDYLIKDEETRKEKNVNYARLRDEFFEVVQKITTGLTIQFKEVNPKTKQVTIITDDGELPIEAISQGATSVMGWVGITLQRLYEIYGADGNPRERYAIVLIDEIDAHMHPEWQQTIVQKLKTIFPNVQFIATTHSPLIIAGMEKKEVLRVRRDVETKEVKVEYIEENFDGLRADQILTSSLFGLQSTRAQGTVGMINRYSELLGKERRTADEENEFQVLRNKLQDILKVGEAPHEREVEDAVRETLMKRRASLQPDQQISKEKLPPQLELEIKRQLAELLGKPEGNNDQG